MCNLNKVVRHIETLKEKLCHCENNLQYIKRLQALQYWLQIFDAVIPDRLGGEYAPLYASYFNRTFGFSFYDKVCNSILDYKYGNRPF